MGVDVGVVEGMIRNDVDVGWEVGFKGFDFRVFVGGLVFDYGV